MVTAVGYNYTDALIRLEDLTQYTVEPTLSVAELARMLRDEAAVADEDGNLPDAWPAWAVATAYTIKYRVVPVTRNGYVYRISTAGTSGSSEPTWPTTIDATVTDGTAVWTCEATAAWTPTYSVAGLDRAALAGWSMKYDKLTAGESFSADGATFNPERRRADIMAKVDFFRKRAGGAGSFRLTGRTSRIENWDSNTTLVVN